MVWYRRAPRALRPATSLALLLAVALVATAGLLGPAAASPSPLPSTLIVDTGPPNGQMAMASRPASAGKIEIEAADDFILTAPTQLTSATFIGLLPTGAPLTHVVDVVVEIYRVFPLDSVNPPDGRVPTRVNSPSDVAFAASQASLGQLTFTTTVLNPTFTAGNSVLNGINPMPGQTTGGEGMVTGEEVQISVTFTPGVILAPDHYFIVPQVQLSGASENFYWLSGQRPASFTPDLQAWIRNDNLDPDWLRVGMDIVGGATPPTFNGAFSLQGTPNPTPTPTATSTTTPTVTATPTPTVVPTGTPTITPTSTLTPTRTPTATPFPHPNVGVQVAAGAGALQSTITARDAACAGGNNQLQSIIFTRLANAAVDVATSPPTTVTVAPFIASLPSHPASVGLTVHRVTAGQAVTVEMIVTDGCGTWPTFIGGGPTAF